MTVAELAKDLDQLARALRSTSSESAALIAQALELDRHRQSTDGGTRFGPKKLTLQGITAAIAKARHETGPSRSHELRNDVFDRRVDKLAQEYTTRFTGICRAGGPVPPGTPIVFASGNKAGRHYLDVLPGVFNRTPLAAELYAWQRAFRYSLSRLLPRYYPDALRTAARTEAKQRNVPDYVIEDRYTAAIDRWVDAHLEIHCTMDAAGRPSAVLGANPTPILALLAATKSGDTDPLRIFSVSQPNTSNS